jgi:hypothetical protein
MENTSKSSESLVESSTEEDSFERTEMAGKTTKRDILSTIKNEHAKDYIGAGSGVMFCYRQMSLSRDRKEKPFDLAGLAWRTSLDIAEAYGWQALGTVHHQIDDWVGNTCSATIRPSPTRTRATSRKRFRKPWRIDFSNSVAPASSMSLRIPKVPQNSWRA